MTGDEIRTRILSVRIIPYTEFALLKELKVLPGHKSLGILTTDCDDVSYAALDEATKKADVAVAYASSMYAGSSNASTRLSGEFIGILSAPDPAQVKSGLEAAIDFIENRACFYSASPEDDIVYFAHCISQSGTYLSEQAKVERGTPLAYLIAPPVEAMVAVDAALKAARVDLLVFYGPPTETNFAGALLTGTQASCRRACEAFAKTVCEVAEAPIMF